MQKLTNIVYVSPNNSNMSTISICMYKGVFTSSAFIYHCVMYVVVQLWKFLDARFSSI